MSDIVYVAASAIGWDDRDSAGHTSSPTLSSTIHHIHTEITVSHGCMGTVPTPAPTQIRCAVDQERA
jgi:hypothetical protein